MKKISLFFVTVCSSVVLFAQQQPQLTTPMSIRTRFGIKGGVNMAEFKVSSSDFSPSSSAPSTEMKTSYNAGVFVNIPFARILRFQPEIEYSSLGSKLTTPATITGGSSTAFQTDLHYINVPLMLQLQTSPGVFVETGPQFGFLTSAKNKGVGTNNSETDVKDYLDKFDFSWGAGIGYLSRVGLGINARYNFGLTNIIDTKKTTGGTGFYENGELKNQAIQIGLFYQFGANK